MPTDRETGEGPSQGPSLASRQYATESATGPRTLAESLGGSENEMAILHKYMRQIAWKRRDVQRTNRRTGTQRQQGCSSCRAAFVATYSPSQYGKKRSPMSPSPVKISFPLKTGSTKSLDAAREVVRTGGKAWNRWRKRHTSIRPDLSNLDLRKVDLSGADLTHSDLSGCKMQNAVLANALIAGSDLTNTNLTGADLSNAGVYESDLINSTLRKAQLNGIRLFWSNLRGADLSYSDMRYIDLSGVDDMTGVNMTGAVVGGDDLW